MKYFFYSKHNDALGLAIHMAQEGDEIIYYCEEEVAAEAAVGFVKCVKSLPEGLASHPDYVIFDMVGNGLLAEKLKKSGYKVFGAGKVNDQLELDRDFATKVCQSLNIRIPESTKFADLTQAQEHIMKNQGRFVLKPIGEAGPEYTYVSDGPVDMVEYMDWLNHSKEKGTKAKGFILQEYIDGIEISTEQWFSKGKPLYPCNGTFETKKFAVDNLGPNTGCQTSVVFNYSVKRPRLVNELLRKIYLLLEKSEYSGPFDMNAMVGNDGKIYWLENSARMGYNAFYAFCETIEVPYGKFISGICDGEFESLPVSTGIFGYSIRVSVMPFPWSSEDKTVRKFIHETTKDKPILLPPGEGEHIWLLDAKKVDGGLATNGFDNVILEVTNKGTTAEEAQAKANEIFNKIHIPNKYARIRDGIERFQVQYPKLVNMGFIPEAKGVQNG